MAEQFLAITPGDPAGVGPEIIQKWLREERDDASGPLALIGPEKWLGQLLLRGTDRRIVVGDTDYQITPGMPDEAGARLALEAMERSAEGCKVGEFSGVVTGPVSKAALAAVGYPYPGQTEFYAARWGGDPVMAFCGGRLRVVLLSWHIPFKKVPEMLTEENFLRALDAAEELARGDGAVSTAPKIGVCGLNPHAGEAGLLGSEELEIIDPILNKLRGRFSGLSGTQPADTVFARALQGEFDVVLALYHDQGLGPVKTLEFDESVNVTLGLPWIRTSPDHGTAFGIAGKGLARTRSFSNAVSCARRLTRSRGRKV